MRDVSESLDLNKPDKPMKPILAVANTGNAEKVVKSTKLDPEQLEQFEFVKDSRMCNDAEAIRWLLEEVWATKGKEIKERAELVRKLKV